MGKLVIDGALDKAHDEVATCTQLDITSDTATPPNLTNSLGSIALTAGGGNGDYVIQDGQVSGRRVTVQEQADVDIAANGTCKHVVLSLSGTIKLVTTCTDDDVIIGDKRTVPAFSYEIRDAS